MRTLLQIIFIFFLFSNIFGQQAEFKKSPISGTWVELNKKSDTLVFLSEYDGQNPIFQLKRGFDSINQYYLPKRLSGPYWYYLGNDQISISWCLSSDSRFQKYYFQLSSDRQKFKILNFFQDYQNSKDTISFIKIK
jgi:hypothetical protein